MLESDSNCIGFAYHRLGIIDEEELIYPPRLGEVMEWFDEVSEVSDADAVGVLRAHLGEEEPTVIHLAVVDKEDPTRILHRRKSYGAIKHETVEEGLGIYLANPNRFKIVFLTAKPLSL